MIKKLMLFVLVLLLLIGCAVENEPPEEDTPVPAPDTEDNEPVEMTLYQGLGKSSNFRNGPGADGEGVPVYSFNYVYADAIFDEEGKIINLYVDALEVSTPNYDGATMPHFSGWPGTEGYNVADENGEITGVSENTEEALTEEVAQWVTKRDRGDSYGMNPNNDWYKQMDFYQEYFRGKTVEEIEEWFEKYTSDRNGRPLNPSTTDEEDQEKLEPLSEDEKDQLAEVVSGATMSLRDAHGDIIGAIRDAYENRVEVNTSPEQ